METFSLVAQCANPQGGEGQTDGGGSLLQLLPPFILMIVVFYFLLIRPQRKREKERQEMVNQIKKNDKIVTNGGIFGTVVTVKEPWVTIKIDDNADTKMKILKSSVAGLAATFEAESAKAEDKDGKDKDKKEKS